MSTTSASIHVLRAGVDAPWPERRSLRAGPLTAQLDGSFLRYISLGGHEVVRGIYAAVRDRNWGTVEPRFTVYDVRAGAEAFQVRIVAEHQSSEVDLLATVEIEGTAAGELTYRFDGLVRRTFRRNRIGICLLHPMTLAGTPLEVETASGTVAGAFPEAISPHQPFVDIVALRQPVPWPSPARGVILETRFEGELFEMEDQRNWTDASYKIYGTPLRLPFPVEVAAGTRVQQAVHLRIDGAPPAGLPGPAPDAGHDLVIRLDGTIAGALPPLGLGVASHGGRLTAAEVERLRRLEPAHLRPTLHLQDDTWEEALSRAAGEARALGAALELEVVAGDRGQGLDRLAAALRRLAASGPAIARVLVFPAGGAVTGETILAAARQAWRAAGLTVPTGGGTRADFVNLNRAAAAGEVPLPLMDAVAYAVNPQVHAFDSPSLVETLAAQAVTVTNARRIAGDRPVCVGPVTLKQRLNPAATGPALAPAPDDLPPLVDPRQLSLFGAGWTMGSVRHLAGAAAVTYFETTGALGVMAQAATSEALGRASHRRFPSRPGMLFPVYHLLAALAPFAGADLLRLEVSVPLAAEAIALRAGRRLRLLVANLTGERQRARVVAPELPGPIALSVAVLDETTAGAWQSDPAAFTPGAPSARDPWREPLDLLPCAVALIDGELP